MEIKVKATMCIEWKGAFLTHQRLMLEFVRAVNSVDLMLVSPCVLHPARCVKNAPYCVGILWCLFTMFPDIGVQGI